MITVLHALHRPRAAQLAGAHAHAHAHAAHAKPTDKCSVHARCCNPAPSHTTTTNKSAASPDPAHHQGRSGCPPAPATIQKQQHKWAAGVKQRGSWQHGTAHSQHRGWNQSHGHDACERAWHASKPQPTCGWDKSASGSCWRRWAAQRNGRVQRLPRPPCTSIVRYCSAGRPLEGAGSSDGPTQNPLSAPTHVHGRCRLVCGCIRHQ